MCILLSACFLGQCSLSCLSGIGVQVHRHQEGRIAPSFDQIEQKQEECYQERRADQFEMLKFVCDQLQKGRHREIEGAPETRAIVKFIYA